MLRSTRRCDASPNRTRTPSRTGARPSASPHGADGPTSVQRPRRDRRGRAAPPRAALIVAGAIVVVALLVILAFTRLHGAGTPLGSRTGPARPSRPRSTTPSTNSRTRSSREAGRDRPRHHRDPRELVRRRRAPHASRGLAREPRGLDPRARGGGRPGLARSAVRNLVELGTAQARSGADRRGPGLGDPRGAQAVDEQLALLPRTAPTESPSPARLRSMRAARGAGGPGQRQGQGQGPRRRGSRQRRLTGSVFGDRAPATSDAPREHHEGQDERHREARQAGTETRAHQREREPSV